MNTNLVLHYISEERYDVFYYNDVYVGSFVREVDGFYYYWPDRGGGAYAEYHLFDLYQNLNALNKEWNEQIDKINEAS